MAGHIDKKSLQGFKDLLSEERDRILAASRNVQTEISVSQDDRSDEADLAATEIQQNVTFRLRDRERLLLSKLNAALERIEEGSFGECMDCESRIPVKRLKARPVSTLCIDCKEHSERREMVYA